MEPSLSSLAYKGSVTGAISEAIQQKKLFVVYISGDNSESKKLESSTWLDPRVAESVSEYCILLHIVEGSNDAMNFSALYPQKLAPCITAVGYNGVLLWQHGGIIDAEIFSSSLKKAWETLTAAPVPKSERSPGTLSSISPEQGSSSRVTVQLPTPSEIELVSDTARPCMDSHNTVKEAAESFEAGPSMESTTKVKEARPVLVQCASGESNNSDAPAIAQVETSYNVGGDTTGTSDDGCSISIDKSELSVEVLKDSSSKATEVEKTSVAQLSSRTSTDAHLNIKLSDGSSLQVKLSATDILREVKDHIDRDQEISSSYDLAVPYPRKVFGDQDLDKTLSELNLLGRQTLLVVLRHKGNLSLRDQNILANKTGSTGGRNEGYFSIVRRLFSYLNPFSFLGESSSSADDAHVSQSGISNNGNGRPYSVSSSDRQPPGSSTIRSRFGRNIHTLKHDDDSPFGDKNAFWNGNSTQFGGDSNK